MATLATSAEHLRKRQYQPSITSFFQQRNGSDSADVGPLSCQTSPMSPPLPAETQSSLLTVGMRVRKSVPEGYKTHKTMPQEEFPFPSTAPAHAPPVRPAYTTTNSRELAPFCGLHKIGGFSAQDSYTAPPSSAPAAFPTGESMQSLSTSQSTTRSTRGSAMPDLDTRVSNKRSYDEEAEDDMDAYFDELRAEDQMAPVEGRRIAKLKGSLQKQSVGGIGVYTPTGGVEGDFEEATFLAPMEDV